MQVSGPLCSKYAAQNYQLLCYALDFSNLVMQIAAAATEAIIQAVVIDDFVF